MRRPPTISVTPTKWVLALCLLLFPISIPAAETFTARVVSVADGDTITILTADHRQVKVRLYGIDCPERKQPWGNRARQATTDAVMGKEVNVHPISTDRYGRTVALVAAPGREMLNSWLVKEGLAWMYPAYCKRADICDRLRELETAAGTAGKGLWADEEPVEPWVWRKEGKTR